tara:strand:+ start:616 stop:954 length:339 start_codon:yes stop_codon:yes gene_type:complete
MSENTFIQKRQRERARPFLTLRIIFGLIFLSLMVWAGFYFEYGSIGDANCDGTCESLHSLGSWVLGFSLIFLGVISLGALAGGLFSLLRWSRKRRHDTLSPFMEKEENVPEK